MKRADASSVRTGWSYFVDALQPHGAVLSEQEDRHPVSGHARLLAQAPYLRLLRWEGLVRRVVPLLIVLMLVTIGVSRMTMLLNEADAIQSDTQLRMGLITEVMTGRLLDAANVERVLNDPDLASRIVRTARPEADTPDGRTYVLADATARILAVVPDETAPEDAAAEGAANGSSDLAERVADLTANLPPDERAAAFRHAPKTQRPMLVATRDVTETRDGNVIRLWILQDEITLLMPWWTSVVLNAAIMLAVAVTTIVILVAFLRQNLRARQADTMYLETQNRFNTALYRGRCGLWDWDLARGRMFWSPSMFELLGREPVEGLLGIADVIPLVHPDDIDLLEMGNEAFRSPTNAIDRRFRIRHANGTWIWLRARAELVRYGGTDAHLIGIAVDISEQEALKEKSARADTLLRDAIENISEAFVLWDSRRRLVMCNSKYQQFYDLPAGATQRGARFEDVAAASRTHRIRQKISPMLRPEEGTHTIEAEMEDGRWLQINERATNDGGLVSVGTDITQIKLNEAKLNESKEHLLSKNEDLERTQREVETQAQKLWEISDESKEAQRRAEEARGRAEAANASKSEFLANISHELRTPLNAIIGFSEVMCRNMFGKLGADQYEEYARDINRSGNHLLDVINDILDMSKIEAGQLELDKERVDLAEIARECVRFVELNVSEKHLDLRCSMPETVPVEADRRALKQIMLNLLSNAVKFTPDEGRIDIKMRRDRGMVKVAICDSGIGIERSALQRLGVPFEQVQNQFTKNHQGSGLGLAIARSLAELHGGDLNIRSVHGRGTLVLIRIPDNASHLVPTPERTARVIPLKDRRAAA